MAKSGNVAADRLKSFVERIEKLREEKKAIGQDERDVFSEAKGVGFDTKAMREVLKRRAMEDRDAWDDLIDTYEHALGLRGEATRIVREGGTYDEAAEATGLSRASVARSVASIKNAENETKEVARQEEDAGEGGIRTHGTPERPADDQSAAIIHSATSATEPVTACPRESHSTEQPPPKPETLYQRITGAFVDPRDDLEPPAFLKRAKA